MQTVFSSVALKWASHSATPPVLFASKYSRPGAEIQLRDEWKSFTFISALWCPCERAAGMSLWESKRRSDFFNLRASAGRGAAALAVLGRAPEENVANFHIILPGAFQRERESLMAFRRRVVERL